MTITRLHSATLCQQQQPPVTTPSSLSPASPVNRNSSSNGSVSMAQENNHQGNSHRQEEEGNNSVLDASIIADSEISIQVTNWIRANYVKEKDHNVPRKNMFEHYKAHCAANHLPPVNSATFGKLLRIVFPDLKTRRLGVRGQSKYHYCGIRVRSDVGSDLTGSGATAAAAAAAGDPEAPNNAGDLTTSPIHHNDNSREIDTSRHHDRNDSNNSNPTMSIPTATGPPYDNNYAYEPQPSYHQPDRIHDGHLPTFQLPSHVPPFRNVDHGMLLSITTLYEQHCRDLLDLVTTNQVDKVKSFILTFYQDMPGPYKELMQSVPEISEAIWRWDCTLFTRELKDYIGISLAQYPSYLCQRKLDVARIFAAKFRRQLSLNFAAQNAASILNSPPHVAHMRESWNKLEVDAILDQTLWVCDCDTNEIKLICVQIFELLNSRSSIENWINWVHIIVEKYLIKSGNVPKSAHQANHYLHSSKQLLLKWNFYTTLIMKDITLQRSEGFGSFQTLRLFLDDYILYLVEESIAQMNSNLMQSLQQQQHADYYHHPPAGPTPSTSTSSTTPSHSQSAQAAASSSPASSSAYHHIENTNNNAASATAVKYRH